MSQQAFATSDGEFAAFPRMPVELQLKVWKYAARQTPRTIEVRFHMRNSGEKHDFITEIPALLHACRISRKEGLKVNDLCHVRSMSKQITNTDQVYKKVFGSKYASHPVYFNKDADTLYLREARGFPPHGQYTFFQARNFAYNLPNKDQLHKLAVTTDALASNYDSQVPYILNFPHLEEVTIVLKLRTDIDIIYDRENPNPPHHECYCFWDIKPGRTHFCSEDKVKWHRKHNCAMTSDDDALIKAKIAVDNFKEQFNDKKWGERDF